MKIYKVEIIDAYGSGFIKCHVQNKTEARQAGRLYIRQWQLTGATIGEIRLVTN